MISSGSVVHQLFKQWIVWVCQFHQHDGSGDVKRIFPNDHGAQSDNGGNDTVCEPKTHVHDTRECKLMGHQIVGSDHQKVDDGHVQSRPHDIRPFCDFEHPQSADVPVDQIQCNLQRIQFSSKSCDNDEKNGRCNG